jgi:hypothetical protein
MNKWVRQRRETRQGKTPEASQEHIKVPNHLGGCDRLLCPKSDELGLYHYHLIVDYPAEVQREIIRYIMGYDYQLRPSQYHGGLTPNESE